MSLHEYREARKLVRADTPFYALIMAAAMRADSGNFVRLRDAFPEVVQETDERYHSGGGVLPGEASYNDIQAARERAGMPPDSLAPPKAEA